jgi:hypothetical protein
MSFDASPEPTLVRLLRDRSETRQQHARAATRGLEVRVARGAYVARETWEGLDARGRHLLRMMAIARTRELPPVFSHWSAAVAHGLPLFGPPPNRVHVLVPRGSGGRSKGGVAAHASELPPEDEAEVAGLRCTSPERTAADLAATAPTDEAIAIADHVLRRRASGPHISDVETRRDRMLAAWMRAQPMRGHRRSLDVIIRADARADSPLESVSRVSMHAAGVPEPELQVPFYDGAGLIGYVDFAWPAHSVVGEADGDAKYLDASLRGGRSAERVVLDEKIREDRLRALGLRVVRWRWATARDPRALSALLTAAGLPIDTSDEWVARRPL